jgi:mycothiol synthase
MSLVVPTRGGWVTRWDAGSGRPADPAAHLQSVLAEAAVNGGGSIVLWIEKSNESLDNIAIAAGFKRWRKLLHMRCSLPTTVSSLCTRAFTETDTDSFLRVNNSAFSWHPEQGGWTVAHLKQRCAEPWFDAEGFRIYEVGGQVHPQIVFDVYV